MKIKLDENLPARLVPILQRQGHDVDTVPEEQLSGRTDTEIWQAVGAEGRFRRDRRLGRLLRRAH